MAAVGSNLNHRFSGKVESRLALCRLLSQSISHGTSVFNWMKFKSAQISKGLHKDPCTFQHFKGQHEKMLSFSEVVKETSIQWCRHVKILLCVHCQQTLVLRSAFSSITCACSLRCLPGSLPMWKTLSSATLLDAAGIQCILFVVLHCSYMSARKGGSDNIVQKLGSDRWNTVTLRDCKQTLTFIQGIFEKSQSKMISLDSTVRLFCHPGD